jgi:hypothetical protein
MCITTLFGDVCNSVSAADNVSTYVDSVVALVCGHTFESHILAYPCQSEDQCNIHKKFPAEVRKYLGAPVRF